MISGLDISGNKYKVEKLLLIVADQIELKTKELYTGTFR